MLDDRYIDSSSWLGSYTAVEDLLSDTLMVSGIKWCPVIDELLYMIPDRDLFPAISADCHTSMLCISGFALKQKIMCGSLIFEVHYNVS